MPSPGLKLAIKVALVAVLIAGISIPIHHQTQDQLLEHVILRDLYFLPIILAAFWFGLKGGLAASLAISLIFLPIVLRGHPEIPARQAADLMGTGLFNVIALVLGLMRDRQRRQQERARKAEALAAVGQAVATVAHDMKTPLMAIGGFTTQVRRQMDENHPSAHKMDTVISQTARLESMVRGMLDFARPLELHPTPVDLAGLVNECLEVAGPLAAQREVELERDLRPPPGHPRLDPYRVQQALLNLVTNALQASPPGSLVRVNLRKQGRDIWLEVLDQGDGIAPEQREQIQSPFFTTKKEGTGLGLPIAKKIAEAHGGRLEMADNHPQGMIFRLVLPAGGQATPKA